jgi:hypothetical protein
MPAAYKVLGQSNPAATTLTTLYTVPAATSTIVSTLSVCNTTSSAATYRIAVRPTGAAIATQHYVVYDAAVAANDTVLLTLGLTLATTDVLSVFASATNVVFQAHGTEIT